MKKREALISNLIVESGNLSYVHFDLFTRWDNKEIEKLSPWDVEPIPDDGN